MTKWQWSVVIALCRVVLMSTWGMYLGEAFQKDQMLLKEAIDKDREDAIRNGRS